MPRTLEMKAQKSGKKSALRRKSEISNANEEVSRWLGKRLKAALLNDAAEAKTVGHASQAPAPALIN